MQHTLITARSFTSLLLVFCFLIPRFLQAQSLHPIASWLDQMREASTFQQVQILSPDSEYTENQSFIDHACYYLLDESAADQLLHQSPATMIFEIPQTLGANIELELAKVEILTPEFSVGVKGTNASDAFPFHPAVHYRGVIRGKEDASIACLSITSTGISAMLADENSTYQLAMMEDGSGRYIFYKTEDIRITSPFHCFSDDVHVEGETGTDPVADDRGVGCKTVNVYFECDYKLYVDKGSSVANVTNYVTSLFNQIATLYANENVGIAVSQIQVWSTPDPYASHNSTANVLNAFRQTLGTNFNGNLAHFLTTRTIGGGIAYVDVICFKQYAFGVSAITTTFQQVPTYSWSVEVVTHELGHNLGSWHTQSCNWTNGALDNCVSPEGSCASGPAPTNGGTIMSYCHLTSYGINFANGFGPQPGAKIREKVLNASCLTPSGSAPTGLATSSVTGTSALLSWNAVAGATTYTVQFKVASSSSWSAAGNTTASSLTLNNLSNNTNYQWQVKTDCSGFSTTASFTTTTGGGGNGGGSTCNPPVGLLVSNITAYSAKLSWNSVPSATQYTIQYKTTSATAWLTAGNVSGTVYTLSGLTAGASYQWKVKANCSAYSAVSNFTTSNSGGGSGSCSTPGGLTNNQIYSTSASISWTPVSGAVSYTLQLKLANSTTYFSLGTIPVTSVTINGLQPSTSYHWRVRANCSFYSTTKLLTTPAAATEGGGDQSFQEPGITYDATGSLELFPNPAGNWLHVKQNITAGDATVQIYNTTGALVLEQVLTEPLQSLDVSGLPNGIYFLTLRSPGRVFENRRFVVQRNQ
ncbi:MAG: fibronectin type III domain-containing protein [Saprospiraceae bacterium]|nr:fibronectin type III domain-containing protein [Saprospiraceae bacterium]